MKQEHQCNYTGCKEIMTEPNIMEFGELKITLWLCLSHQLILENMKTTAVDE